MKSCARTGTGVSGSVATPHQSMPGARQKRGLSMSIRTRVVIALAGATISVGGIGGLSSVAMAAPPSGDLSQPQPLSTADTNTGGANGQCPGGIYCSTRDGSPSLNGNGDGNASGRPCAGCVGKADNKNPPGQESTDPAGTFPNNGYECDTNNGIGKSNPAHTGCTTPKPPCPE